MLVNFVVADNITFSHDQKPILMGFYPDRKVLLTPTSQTEWIEPSADRPIMVPQFAMMATIDGARPGSGSSSISIETPLGPFGPSLPKNSPVTVGGNGMANLNYQFNGFPVTALGTYRVTIILNDQTVMGEFEVLRA